MADEYRSTGIGEKSRDGIAPAGAEKAGPAGKERSAHPAKKRGRVIKLADKNIPEPVQAIAPDDIIFAMDIGTRTVAGVVGVQEGECFRVLATEVCEHKSRAMMDGQIHDIDQTVLTVSEVKRRLEARIGTRLTKVAIAAAGRVLKTCQVRVEKNIEQGTEIDDDLVSSMEIEGIQRAQMILDENAENDDKTQYYCVGYSVINYYLNGYVISNLKGHRGKTAGADILATFLPLIVVDSLYAVVNRVGLEVSSLTLEPIAAINAAIPPDFRLLNLALVDIGAGTSDIALTRDGSVYAYAMVPTAGDEITERIAQCYLVDFNTAEKIKISLSSGKESITFTDILKKKHTVLTMDVLKDIEDSIRELSSTICRKILEYNNKTPNAVFLVGGGSRIPMLAGMVAEQLGLPEDRVVVRGRDVIKDIRFCDKKLSGPESITPYGIAVTAQMHAGKDFVSVTVNDKKIKLFNAKKLTVADALIMYGFDAADLIGRSGKSITFTVNGEIRRVRGEHGIAAEIWLNGKPAGLDTPLRYGDSIKVIPARDGKDAEVKAYELVSDFGGGIVSFNGNPVDISTTITINGTRVQRDTPVKDGDTVEITAIRTLKDLLAAAGYSAGECDVKINGMEIRDPDYVLRDRDVVLCLERGTEKTGGISKEEEAAEYEIQDTVVYEKKEEEAAAGPDDADDTAEEDGMQADGKQNEAADSFEVIVNGKAVNIQDSSTQHIFVDIFNHIDFDLSKPQGTIVLRLNSRPAAFTDVIRQGDIIEIYWSK